jgi:hypothetical protein
LKQKEAYARTPVKRLLTNLIDIHTLEEHLGYGVPVVGRHYSKVSVINAADKRIGKYGLDQEENVFGNYRFSVAGLTACGGGLEWLLNIGPRGRWISSWSSISSNCLGSKAARG